MSEAFVAVLMGSKSDLPVIEKTIKHARKRQKVSRPFFPGYLFIHLSPSDQSWAKVSSTKGVSSLVRFGNTVPQVPSWVIDSLKSLEDDRQVLQPRKILDKKLIPGAKVSVVLPEQKAVEGIFQCFQGKDRAVVLLDILSRQVKTVTPCSTILV